MEPSQKKSPSFLELALKASKEGKYNEYITYLKKGINNTQCKYLLACCYLYGFCGVDENNKKALKLFTENVTLKHHYRSMLFVIFLVWNGIDCVENQEYANKLQEEILKSEKNHYEKGFVLRKFKQKKKEAFEEFMKATTEDDGELYLEIGRMIYFQETELPKKQSLDWFKKAVDLGNINATEYMAMWFYDYNRIDTEYYEKQIYWWKRYFQMSRDINPLSQCIRVHPVLITNDNIDSLINFELGKYYNYKATSDPLDDYNYWFKSWKFFSKSTEEDAIELLKIGCYLAFTKCLKATLTILCISKYTSRIFPKDIWKLLAKYVWKTKLDEEWQE
jgi:TPR repeat protein